MQHRTADHGSSSLRPRPSVYWFHEKAPAVEPLRGDIRCEVAVVGGGIAGLTCSHLLAMRGIDVALLERESCGAGASGRSSGFITPESELELVDLVKSYGPDRARELWEFALSGLARIRRTIADLAIDCDDRIDDCLFVARTARAFRKVIQAEHGARRSLGYESTLYDRDGLKAIVGSRGFHGGIRYGGTFGISSHAYCRALRAELVRLGARIHEGTSATRLTARGVVTGQGEVAANAVAVFTDRWLPELGLAAPAVDHVQTFLAVSRPLRDADIRAIFPRDRLMVWDTDLIYQYFRIVGEQRLLLGASRLWDTYSRHTPRSPAGMLRKMRRYLSRQFPDARVELEYFWPGRIGVSKDFLPVVGRHDALPAVHFAGAGAGLPWSSALGEYVADKLTDGRSELDEVFSPHRPFAIRAPVGRILGRPVAFALNHAVVKYLRS